MVLVVGGKGDVGKVIAPDKSADAAANVPFGIDREGALFWIEEL